MMHKRFNTYEESIKKLINLFTDGNYYNTIEFYTEPDNTYSVYYQKIKNVKNENNFSEYMDCVSFISSKCRVNAIINYFSFYHDEKNNCCVRYNYKYKEL